MIRVSWTYFKWGLIATVLAGLGTWLYIERRVDDEIRRHAEAWLSSRCPKLAVSVASARLVEGEGIYLRDVGLKSVGRAGASADLATIEEIFLECDTSLPRLVRGDVTIGRFVLRRPRLHCARQADGSWNVAALLAESPCAEEPLMPGEIEEGVLELTDATRQPASRWTLRDVNLTFTPGRDEHGAFFRVAGKFSGDHLRQVEMVALDHRPKVHSTALHAKLLGLEISPALLAALPREAAEQAAALAALQARADVDVKLAHVCGQTPPWRFDVATHIKEGRLNDPRLPFPLEQMQGEVRVDNQGVTIPRLTASHLQTALRLDARRQGWGPAAPMSIHIDGKQVVLGPRMRDALPPEWRAVWNDFSPEGEADVDATLTFDGRAWRRQATLTARNMAIQYSEYPYPLQRGAGTLTMDGEQIQFDLTGLARGVPVRAEGKINGIGPPGRGTVHIVADKLRSDADMIAALPPASRKIVDSFHAAGVFDLDLTLWWQPHDPVIHRTMKLAIHEAIGRYDRFPYALTNFSGLIEQLSDDEWRFTELRALHGAGQIAGKGLVKPWRDAASPDRGLDDHLELHLRAENISLNEELREALPPATRRLWATLKPQGTVDLGLDFYLLVKQDRTSLTVDITPRGDTVSIEPAAFPYRWEKIKGQATYRDGQVTLRNLEAAHGDTVCHARQGSARVDRNGGWELMLNDLSLDRLRVDRDLVRAAPDMFRQLLSELNPTGSFNLHGDRDALWLSQGGQPTDPLRAVWNVDVLCHGNSLQTALPLENLFGSVRLNGQALGGQASVNGQLALDSITCRGLQFTEVRGPFLIEPSRILLGAPLDERLQAGPRRISARCYEGALYGDAWLRRKELPVAATGGRANATAVRVAAAPWEFSLRANLEQADLGRFAREAVAGRQKISGRLDGNLTLNGSSQSLRDLQGAGTLRLRETNLYELPLFLSLLPVLSLKEPDLTAFTSGDVEFRVNGSDTQVYFPKINLRGEALSLSGRGAMGFDRKLALVFEPQLGSQNRVPIIGQLLRSAQIVEVYVGGTLDQPLVHQEPFPGVKEALENLQPAPLRPQMGTTPGSFLPGTMRTNPLSPLR